MWDEISHMTDLCHKFIKTELSNLTKNKIILPPEHVRGQGGLTLFLKLKTLVAQIGCVFLGNLAKICGHLIVIHN